MRIGCGYDAHRLEYGRQLVLGGVELPYHKGLAGHSDADVLSHAVIDALLGAAALGDIGAHFPDSDMRYRGACSLELLRETARLVRVAGYEIINVDSTVIAQEPRLSGAIALMRDNIAGALEIDAGRVSVKATTEEGMGFTGSGLGIAAQAVCLIEHPADN